VETLLADSETLDVTDRDTRHWEVPTARATPRVGRQPGRGHSERQATCSAVSAGSDELSDEALLARLSRGDVSAGEKLVARHYAPLMRYLQRTAGPRAAEDLLQQTWLSVLTHADRFVADAGSGSFRGWLFRIATNKTKDHWRSAGREKAAKDGYARVTEGAAPWAGHVADGAEQCEKLRLAIDGNSHTAPSNTPNAPPELVVYCSWSTCGTSVVGWWKCCETRYLVNRSRSHTANAVP